MANKLPEIIWPAAELSKPALIRIQDYTFSRFKKLIESLPMEQQSAAYDILAADLKNGGKEFGRYLQ